MVTACHSEAIRLEQIESIPPEKITLGYFLFARELWDSGCAITKHAKPPGTSAVTTALSCVYLNGEVVSFGGPISSGPTCLPSYDKIMEIGFNDWKWIHIGDQGC